jgi:hypothetical protein
MDTFDVLVLILSVTLFIFLTTAIVALVFFIRLIKKVGEATESAKHAVENVEAMTDTIKNVANGSVVAGVVGSLFDKFRTKSKNKKG